MYIILEAYKAIIVRTPQEHPVAEPEYEGARESYTDPGVSPDIEGVAFYEFTNRPSCVGLWTSVVLYAKSSGVEGPLSIFQHHFVPAVPVLKGISYNAAGTLVLLTLTLPTSAAVGSGGSIHSFLAFFWRRESCQRNAHVCP